MSGNLPNPDLASLAAVLGEENVRILIRTFLAECPGLLGSLETGDRRTRQRIAHSLKSNTRVLGARAFSDRMAELERRLSNPEEPDLTPAEFADIAAELQRFSEPLRAYAG